MTTPLRSTAADMQARALVLGVALAAALVAYPRPVEDRDADGRAGRTHLARALTIWSNGPLPIARADILAYTVVPTQDTPWLGPARAGAPKIVSVPGQCLAPEEALAALRDRTRPRLDVVSEPGSAAAARALPRLLEAVKRRARVEGELWLVALVERGAGRAGEDVVRLGLHGSAALLEALEPEREEISLDPRWLGDGLTREHLDAWFTAHVAGAAETARERWPRWLLRRPALGMELTANGDASEPWPDGASPPGWTSQGQVVRALGADGRAWFEAPDGWCSLEQHVPLPVPSGLGPRLEARLAARFAPGTRGTVQLLCESGGSLELTGTGERRALLPPGARTAYLEVRLTGSTSRNTGAAALAPRLTGVSIRVVPADE